MINDPGTIAGIVILGPVLFINLILYCLPRVYLFTVFRRFAEDRGFTFEKIRLLPCKFKLKIDQNDVVFDVYGLKGALFTAEVTIAIQTDIDLEIKFTDWYEKASAHLDKKLKNSKSYDYLFGRRYVIVHSNIEKGRIVELFGYYVSRILSKVCFGLYQINIKNNKIVIYGRAMPWFKPNYIYSKIIEDLITNLNSQCLEESQI